MKIKYNFEFAGLAVEFLQTHDEAILAKIAETDAAKHLLNHAIHCNYNVPKQSELALVTHLLGVSNAQDILSGFIRNVEYAKENIADCPDILGTVANFLPKDFDFSCSLYFTFGYDIGVAHRSNCSLNLAHPHFLNRPSELKYYAVHVLHHAGFMSLKAAPSLNVKTREEMAHLIEYLTQLEGMAVYAPYVLRKFDYALNIDQDYIALQDNDLIKESISEYFEIYNHFKNHPALPLENSDWDKIAILSDVKRLWYRVGAHMAHEIEKVHGRDFLTALIAQPSENFINSYKKIHRL